jgi:hypothetical protein
MSVHKGWFVTIDQHGFMTFLRPIFDISFYVNEIGKEKTNEVNEKWQTKTRMQDTPIIRAN